MLKKSKKLISNPKQFFRDSTVLDKFFYFSSILRSHRVNKPKVLAIHMNHWKRESIRLAFPEYDWLFLPFRTSIDEVIKKCLLIHEKNVAVVVWGYNEPLGLPEELKKINVNLYRMEDGFVRSLGLGANHELPYSLVLDKMGVLYFDSRKASDLENIYNNYNFNSDPKLLEKASECLSLLVEKDISKYNHVEKFDCCSVFSSFEKNTERQNRILVIGQVETDASIKYGANRKLNNLDLVEMARKENPHAQIFFKPHPDVLEGKRSEISSLEEIAQYAHVLSQPLPISNCIDEVDEVYTISSLSGFEALLRDKKVTTLGSPFYSGWGLTVDKQPNNRRQRTLTKLELFAGAYLLYPRYFNPHNGERMTLEKVINKLSVLRESPISS